MVTVEITSFDALGEPVKLFWNPPKNGKGGTWTCYKLKLDNNGNESYTQRCPTPGRIMAQRTRDDVDRIRAEMVQKGKKRAKELKR